jgi:excisionase family DNA binding protein
LKPEVWVKADLRSEKMAMSDSILTTADVAALVKCSPATVKRAVDNKLLRARRMRARGKGESGQLRFTRADVDRWLRSWTVVGDPVDAEQDSAPPPPALKIRRTRRRRGSSAPEIIQFV